MGDECTKFFHAMATISHRKNSIPQLLNDDGAWILDHEGKAALIWNSFKVRMGISTNPTMLFGLHSLFQVHGDFSSLVEPFSHDDIDNVVRRLPLDKAPGPDGFNGFFIKKCWHIIKGDFYKLCDDFFQGTLCIDSINSSFITLVPKINNPETISDYRPISLLNCRLKILTKLLADRLQQVITRLIHKNQYSFIRSRTIQDCLGWCFAARQEERQSFSNWTLKRRLIRLSIAPFFKSWKP